MFVFFVSSLIFSFVLKLFMIKLLFFPEQIMEINTEAIGTLSNLLRERG